MTEVVVCGLFLGIIVFVIVCILIFVSYDTHKSMTIKASALWNHVNFSKFLHKFNSIQTWYWNQDYPDSLFTTDDTGYIHASIIRFGNRGMVLRPFSHVRYLRWIRHEIARRNNKQDSSLWVDL